MEKKSRIARFGEAIIDVDLDNITQPWNELIETSNIRQLGYDIEKFCLYLTLYNNFWVENKGNYPKRISKIDPFVFFFGVLIRIAFNHKEETISDIKKLFDFWVSFLNENADTFDKFSGEYANTIALTRFEKLITFILTNDR